MLAMTHHVDDEGRLLVSAMASGCKCEFTVHIDTQTRAGLDGRKGLTAPKQWYREAENILLSGGRVFMDRVGNADTTLECKKHKNG